MIGFALAAALLVIVAVLLVLRPLWSRRARTAPTPQQLNAAVYRDQLAELERDLAAGSVDASQAQPARAELHKRLLGDVAEAGGDDETAAAPRPGSRRIGVVLAVGVPAFAMLLYLALGTPAALDPQARVPVSVTPEQIEKMVAGLAARLETQPDDAKGWAVLARSYAALGRRDDALRAYERAWPEVQKSVELLLAYAELLAERAGGRMDGRPQQLIDAALRLDAEHPDANLVAGKAAYQRGDGAAAVAHWTKLRRRLDPESAEAQAVDIAIAKAQELASKGTAGASSAAPR